MRDFYKVLGIASAADDTQVKSAFRHLAKTFHPDLNPEDKQAEQRFREVNEAYEVLRDARARASYDGFLAERRSEVRRRFTHSATVMVATFMLTMGCAYVVMALHGAGLPLWEGRQLANAPAHVSETTKSAPAGRANSGSDAIAGVAATTLASAMPLPLEPPAPDTGILRNRTTDDRPHPDVVASAAAPATAPGLHPPANVQPTAETRTALSAGDAVNLPSPEQGADAREADSKLPATDPGPQDRIASVHLDRNAPVDHTETANLDPRPTADETAGALGVVKAVWPLQRRNSKLASGRLEPETLPPAKAPKKLAAAIEAPKTAGGEPRKTALQASGPASQGGQPWPTADEPFVGAGTTSR